MQPTIEIAKKVLNTVDAGLCSGVGNRVPGEMCIEAAVCFAFDLPHGDEPPCVGSAVRSFKIALNDCNWSSNAARAKGMRKIAIAQLGSDGVDQKKFSGLLALKTIQQLCPKLFLELAKLAKEKGDKTAMEKAAKNCAEAQDLKSAVKILDLNLALNLNLDLNLDLALNLARNLARARALDLDLDLALDLDLTRNLARALALALARDQDEALILMADTCLECLIELKSPGCEWLTLCD